MGNNAATTPAMMRDPISGTLQCTKQGVLDAQVHHTKQLGSQQQFTTDNPHFDSANSAFMAHVTAEVAASAVGVLGCSPLGPHLGGGKLGPNPGGGGRAAGWPNTANRGVKNPGSNPPGG
jgi:hypothetical protein